MGIASFIVGIKAIKSKEIGSLKYIGRGIISLIIIGYVLLIIIGDALVVLEHSTTLWGFPRK